MEVEELSARVTILSCNAFHLCTLPAHGPHHAMTEQLRR